MEEIIWSALASKDILNHYQYKARDSKLYADRWIDKVLVRIGILQNQLNIGRIVPEKKTTVLPESL